MMLDDLYNTTNDDTTLDILHGPVNPTVDIVFVHGLNALNTPHYRKAAWTAPNGVFWPKDLLPYDVPTARIMLFGYNSNVLFSRNLNGITEHGRSLLEALALRRIRDGANISKRPIIFVAHSMGGIVTKRALLEAKDDDIWYTDIDQCTHGLIFYGTPHYYGNYVKHGARTIRVIDALTGGWGERDGIFDLRKTIRRIGLPGTKRDRGNNLMARLEPDSSLSKEEQAAFSTLWSRWRVTTFYEGRRTPLRGLGNFVGKVLPKMFVVDKKAAVIGDSCVGENVFMFDADHTNMNKFSAASDPIYVRSVNEIQETMKHCLKVRAVVEAGEDGTEDTGSM